MWFLIFLKVVISHYLNILFFPKLYATIFFQKKNYMNFFNLLITIWNNVAANVQKLEYNNSTTFQESTPLH
jgi:hypothetical protein